MRQNVNIIWLSNTIWSNKYWVKCYSIEWNACWRRLNHMDFFMEIAKTTHDAICSCDLVMSVSWLDGIECIIFNWRQFNVNYGMSYIIPLLTVALYSAGGCGCAVCRIVSQIGDTAPVLLSVRSDRGAEDTADGWSVKLKDSGRGAYRLGFRHEYSSQIWPLLCHTTRKYTFTVMG